MMIDESGPDTGDKGQSRTGRRGTGSDPVRVLLVEDNRKDAVLLRRLLSNVRDACFELTVVQSLSAALAAAQGSGCDVVLLDLSLPDSSGSESVQQLALALPRTPIVVLTGLDREDMAVQALRRGAQDYLVKGGNDPLLIGRSIRYAIERKAFEGELAERAHFDSLTGLVNRALFHDRLEQAVTRASRAGRRVALMFIDLDGFKEVNDTLGHEIGDQVLKAVAKLLRGAARKNETVARLGGDEFTVVLEQTDDISDVAVVAKRILRAFEAPIATAGKEIRVTCSVGIAVFPDTASDAESLLRNADAAMFHAKKSGRNNVRFHENS